MLQRFDPKAELKFPDWVDATALSSFKACERRGFYDVILRLTTEEPNPHFNAGGAFAKAQEHCRELIYGPPRLSQDEAVARSLLTLIREYGPYDPPAEAKPSVAAKTWMGVADALIRYYHRWPVHMDWCMPDMFGDYDPDTGGIVARPSNEFSFAVPIGDFTHPQTGMPILYAGRADMRVRVGPSGVWTHYKQGSVSLDSLPLYIFDDKTTWQLGSTWAQQWPMRSQFIGYAWANNVIVGKDSPNLKAVGAVVSGAGIQKSQTKTERAVFEIPQWKIDEWYDDTCYTIQRMLDCWHRNRWHKAWDSACTMYSGCDWREVCDSANPEPWLKQMFISEWNPVPQKEEG